MPPKKKRKRDWWAEERGHPIPPAKGSRGEDAINAYKKGGPILFAGGPWNGKFIPLKKWVLGIHAPAPLDKFACLNELRPIAPRESIGYQLRHMVSAGGAVFFMYVADGYDIKNDDGELSEAAVGRFESLYLGYKNHQVFREYDRSTWFDSLLMFELNQSIRQRGQRERRT